MQTEDETLRRRRYEMNEVNVVEQSLIAQALYASAGVKSEFAFAMANANFNILIT